MESLANQLPPEIAKHVHPDWRKNEAEYWTQREALLEEYRDCWVGFADGEVLVSGRSPVDVFHKSQESGRHPFVTCVGREHEPCRVRRAVFSYDETYPGEALPLITAEFRKDPAGWPGLFQAGCRRHRKPIYVVQLFEDSSPAHMTCKEKFMLLVLMIVASPITFASEAPLVPQRETAANHRIIVRYLEMHRLPVGIRVRKVIVPRQNPVSSFPNVVTRYDRQDWTELKVKPVPVPSFIDRGALIRKVNDIESSWRRTFRPILIDDTHQ